MKGLFNYESTLIQSILRLGDILILNLLYIICCLPLFTIGAAQAGLYTGFRVMLDPQDDSSCTAAFFRGFKNGFSVITPVWLLLTCAIAVAGGCCIAGYAMGSIPLILFAFVALVIAVCVQTLSPVLHSRFSYSRSQLARNAFFLLAAYPLQAVFSVMLMWMPVLLFLLANSVFTQLALLFLICWYGVAGLLSVAIMRRPFEALEEHFFDTHDENGNSLSATGDDDE